MKIDWNFWKVHWHVFQFLTQHQQNCIYQWISMEIFVCLLNAFSMFLTCWSISETVWNFDSQLKVQSIFFHRNRSMNGSKQLFRTYDFVNTQGNAAQRKNSSPMQQKWTAKMQISFENRSENSMGQKTQMPLNDCTHMQITIDYYKNIKSIKYFKVGGWVKNLDIWLKPWTERKNIIVLKLF